jgi:hypothetical protein
MTLLLNVCPASALYYVSSIMNSTKDLGQLNLGNLEYLVLFLHVIFSLPKYHDKKANGRHL